MTDAFVCFSAHSQTVTSEDFSHGRDLPPAPKRWLEVSVAVDNSVIDFHGREDTEKYIFTLFNIVSKTSLMNNTIRKRGKIK